MGIFDPRWARFSCQDFLQFVKASPIPGQEHSLERVSVTFGNDFSQPGEAGLGRGRQGEG